MRAIATTEVPDENADDPLWFGEVAKTKQIVNRYGRMWHQRDAAIDMRTHPNPFIRLVRLLVRYG